MTMDEKTSLSATQPPVKTSSRRSIHALLHKLWTKAVGTTDYVKSEWIALANTVEMLERRKVDRSKNTLGGNAGPTFFAKYEDDMRKDD